ncbi:hypothetical protein MY11210_009378 [Beauveria gryllotalpidicola]
MLRVAAPLLPGLRELDLHRDDGARLTATCLTYLNDHDATLRASAPVHGLLHRDNAHSHYHRTPARLRRRRRWPGMWDPL